MLFQVGVYLCCNVNAYPLLINFNSGQGHLMLVLICQQILNFSTNSGFYESGKRLYCRLTLVGMDMGVVYNQIHKHKLNWFPMMEPFASLVA